jgi:hypothetical protein
VKAKKDAGMMKKFKDADKKQDAALMKKLSKKGKKK